MVVPSTLTWRHFADLASANAYCDAQTALLDLPPGGETQRWADPTALADGSYVVPAYRDATAVPWDASWVLPTPSDA